MNSRLWRLLMLVIARPELLLADTGVIAEAGQGLGQGFMILLAVAALIVVVICSSILSWFIREIKIEPVQTTEYIPKPFENQQRPVPFQKNTEPRRSAKVSNLKQTG